jgi:hypothetical protein
MIYIDTTFAKLTVYKMVTHSLLEFYDDDFICSKTHDWITVPSQ